jgi:hypothetical protein
LVEQKIPVYRRKKLNSRCSYAIRAGSTEVGLVHTTTTPTADSAESWKVEGLPPRRAITDNKQRSTPMRSVSMTHGDVSDHLDKAS